MGSNCQLLAVKLVGEWDYEEESCFGYLWNEPGSAEFFSSSNLYPEITDSRRPRAFPALQEGFHFWARSPGKGGSVDIVDTVDPQ